MVIELLIVNIFFSSIIHSKTIYYWPSSRFKKKKQRIFLLLNIYVSKENFKSDQIIKFKQNLPIFYDKSDYELYDQHSY